VPEPLKHRSISSSGRSLSDLVHWVGTGDIDLSPSYQRGDVWTEAQRVNLIKSILMGIPIAALVINKRGDNAAWESTSGPVEAGDPYYACIDGKQRLTTGLMWMRSEFAVPRHWFDDGWVDSDAPGAAVYFDDLSPAGRRFFRNVAILPVAEAKLRDVAEEAEVYDLINSAGTAHTDADLATARALKA
jgi:hypothetical protein